jgi:preprotein translocase subunit SecD
MTAATYDWQNLTVSVRRKPVSVRRKIAVLAVLQAAMRVSVAAAESPCAEHLTFRWTSGNAIRTDVAHPDEASLRNQPFLRDPEIVSVTTGHDRFGPRVMIRFGAEAAAVLATETSAHVGQQMMIMLGDRMISAAIVREPVRDVAVLSVPYDDKRLDKLARMLRNTPGGHVSRASPGDAN